MGRQGNEFAERLSIIPLSDAERLQYYANAYAANLLRHQLDGPDNYVRQAAANELGQLEAAMNDLLDRHLQGAVAWGPQAGVALRQSKQGDSQTAWAINNADEGVTMEAITGKGIEGIEPVVRSSIEGTLFDTRPTERVEPLTDSLIFRVLAGLGVGRVKRVRGESQAYQDEVERQMAQKMKEIKQRAGVSDKPEDWLQPVDRKKLERQVREFLAEAQTYQDQMTTGGFSDTGTYEVPDSRYQGETSWPEPEYTEEYGSDQIDQLWLDVSDAARNNDIFLINGEKIMVTELCKEAIYWELKRAGY